MFRRIMMAGAMAVAGLFWGTDRADAQWGGYYSGVQVHVARPVVPVYSYRAYSPIYGSAYTAVPYSVGYPTYSSYYSAYRPYYPAVPVVRYRVPAYRVPAYRVPAVTWPYVSVGY